MGRASREEAARTRMRIVETASEMARASGADKVVVADVMAALGLTTGGFYRHFASRDALMAEAVGLAFDQSVAAWPSSGAASDDGENAGVADLVAHYLRPDPHRRCPMIAFAGADDALGGIYGPGAGALLARFLAVAVSDGDPGGAESENSSGRGAAMVLFAAMIGARILKESASGAEWADEIRAAVLEAATTVGNRGTPLSNRKNS